jgi:Lon protease-like protein
MAHTVRVNFSRPMPIFPLHGVVLLPHAVLPMQIFEPRYRQMIEDCLDQSGQVALASFAGAQPRDPVASPLDEQPRLRPAVCVGQIIQHEKQSDGRHNILLHGVCRATIREMVEPSSDRLYRMARLLPLEVPEQEPPRLESIRRSLKTLLTSNRLRRMHRVRDVLNWFGKKDVPTHALIELVGFTLIYDPEIKYTLLAEPSVVVRARLITSELQGLERVLGLADRQSYRKWEKGQSWN